MNYNKVREKITKEYIREAVMQVFKEGKSEEDKCAADMWKAFPVNAAHKGGPWQNWGSMH